MNGVLGSTQFGKTLLSKTQIILGAIISFVMHVNFSGRFESFYDSILLVLVFGKSLSMIFVRNGILKVIFVTVDN